MVIPISPPLTNNLAHGQSIILGKSLKKYECMIGYCKECKTLTIGFFFSMSDGFYMLYFHQYSNSY